MIAECLVLVSLVGAISAVLLLLLFVFFVGAVEWELSSFVRTIDLMPGPERSRIPFVGNFPFFFGKQSDEILQIIQNDFTKKYGGIYRLWLGRRAFVDISDPDLIEKVTTSQELIDKSQEYDMLAPWLGNGLLLASGAEWHRNRRLLTPAFHFRMLDEYLSEFNKNADALCDKLADAVRRQQRLRDDGSTRRGEIDVLPLIRRSTLDMICETAMGIETEKQKGYKDYIEAVERFANVLHERFMTPIHFLPSFVYNLTKHGKEYRRLLGQLHSFTDQVIRERKRSLDNEESRLREFGNDADDADVGLKKKRPFMDLLLVEAKTNPAITDEYIRSEVDTFMFEGHDTTAAAITWFLYCMATNTQQQEAAREELAAVFGDAGWRSGPACSMDDIGRMKHLERCIKESLRLYPPVPNFKRRVPADIELGGYKVPAGASVSIHVYALHRSERHFGPDPLAFRPQRFDDIDSRRHPFAFLPFSAGPRNCIGQRVAMLEMKVLASRLLRRFRFVYDTATHGPARPCQDLVLKPKHGMPLLITPVA